MTCPTTPSFPPPGEQRARVVIKPALPSAACPRTSPGKHRTPPPKPLLQGKGGRRQDRKERGAQEATGIWTGLAWPQGRKGEQTNPSWGGFLYLIQESKV